MKNSSLKDFILPLGLVLLTFWIFNTFFFKTSQTGQQEHTFVAPASGISVKPINTTVDFSEGTRQGAAVITHIETSWGAFDFSTQAASLDTAAFKKTDDGLTQKIYTIFSTENKEQRFFLVALSEKTPFNYELIDKNETEHAFYLTYQHIDSQFQIEKTFIIYKELNKIDLRLSINPYNSVVIQPRIFFESPLMPELQNDMISAVVIDGESRYARISRASIKDGQGWFRPAIFGADNKYYLHALVNDENSFVQRAYYKSENKDVLIAIVEGPEVTQKTTWNLSFYLGPKDTETMSAVEARLDQAAHYYGWLAPLSKFLLYLLKLLNRLFNNFGVSIVALTILMNFVLFPFSFRGEKGMAQSRENQKKLSYIEQKYKNDPERLAQERADFLRKHGLTGIGSCLPMFLKMPVFFALNRVLSSAPEMYKASFLWISDLSSTDPYYVFPALIFLGMIFNAFTVDEQQRSTMLIIAFVIGAFAASFSAGLSLFIFVGTVVGIVQAKFIKALS